MYLVQNVTNICLINCKIRFQIITADSMIPHFYVKNVKKFDKFLLEASKFSTFFSSRTRSNTICWFRRKDDNMSSVVINPYEEKFLFCKFVKDWIFLNCMNIPILSLNTWRPIRNSLANWRVSMWNTNADKHFTSQIIYRTKC